MTTARILGITLYIIIALSYQFHGSITRIAIDLNSPIFLPAKNSIYPTAVIFGLGLILAFVLLWDRSDRLAKKQYQALCELIESAVGSSKAIVLGDVAWKQLRLDVIKTLEGSLDGYNVIAISTLRDDSDRRFLRALARFVSSKYRNHAHFLFYAQENNTDHKQKLISWSLALESAIGKEKKSSKITIPDKRIRFWVFNRNCDEAAFDITIIGSHVFITIYTTLTGRTEGAQRIYIDDSRISGSLAEMQEQKCLCERAEERQLISIS